MKNISFYSPSNIGQIDRRLNTQNGGRVDQSCSGIDSCETSTPHVDTGAKIQ